MKKASHLPGLSRCPSCGVEPCTPHRPGCEVERCSVCGLQRCQCDCHGHDPQFSRWTGIWPGEAEAIVLGFVLPGALLAPGIQPDLNRFYAEGYHKIFFVKPKP